MEIKIFNNSDGRGSTVVAYHGEQSDSFYYDPKVMSEREYEAAMKRIAYNVSGLTGREAIDSQIEDLKKL